MPDVPAIPKQAPGQSTASFIVENAKAVAGIGMAVLAAGLIVMILLSLLGNVGLKPSEHSADGAYAPTTVEVHAHKKVSLGHRVMLVLFWQGTY